jgi:hypothetical protein
MPRYEYKNFREYWESLNNRERPLLARLAGVSYQWLWAIANGHKNAGAETIAKLGKVDPRITPRLLRPDLYGKKVYTAEYSQKRFYLPDPAPAKVRKLNKERGTPTWNKGLKTGSKND